MFVFTTRVLNSVNLLTLKKVSMLHSLFLFLEMLVSYGVQNNAFLSSVSLGRSFYVTAFPSE